MASYWSDAGNILIIYRPIGQIQGIFSSYGVLLVRCREYSHDMASYWSDIGNILMIWRLIGQQVGSPLEPVTGTVLVADLADIQGKVTPRPSFALLLPFFCPFWSCFCLILPSFALLLPFAVFASISPFVR
jgi:hypothetical protein